jgi:hypothetical protein
MKLTNEHLRIDNLTNQDLVNYKESQQKNKKITNELSDKINYLLIKKELENKQEDYTSYASL